nr:hypothetical protein [uncultured Mediterranean phage uvMED]
MSTESILLNLATALITLVLFSFGFVLGYAARKSEEQ